MGRLFVSPGAGDVVLRRKSQLAAAVGGVALALSASSAQATEYDWTDPTSGNWSVDDFWNPGAPPTNGNSTTDLVFYTDSTAPSSYTANNNLGNPFSLHSLIFRNFAETDISLSGNALRFTGTDPLIQLEWTGENAVLNPIQFSTTTTFNSTFDGKLLLAGPISGTGGLTLTAGALHISGASTYSGDITIGSGATLFGAAGGALSSASTIVMSPGSALSLKIPTSFTINATTITAGSYSQSIGGLSGSGFVDLGSAALTLGASNASTTFGGVIDGDASLTKIGTGTLTLTNEVAVPQININAGAIAPASDIGLAAARINLNVNNGLALTGMSEVTIGGLSGAGNLALPGTILSVIVADPLTYSGVISGSGALIKGGGQTWDLTGNNTYTGGITVGGGVLRVAKDAALGATTGGVSLNAGTLEFAAQFDLASTRPFTLIGGGTIDTGSFSTTLSQSIGESGFVSSLSKSGSGTLALSGSASSYSGGTTVSEGTLVLNHANAAGTGDINVNDGLSGTDTALLLGQRISLARAINVNGSPFQTALGSLAAAGNASTFAGNISLVRSINVVAGSGGVNRFDGAISGAGNFNISGTQTVQFRGAAKTYTGQTDIAPGAVLSLVNDSASPVGSTVRVQSGATLALEGATSPTLGGLSGDGVVRNTGGLGVNVKIGNNGASTTFFGSFAGGPTSIEKVGIGTLVLSGTKSIDGNTTITAGILQVGSAANLGPNTVSNGTVLNGGTLKTTGSFSLNQVFTANGGAIDATGQTLTLSGPFGTGGPLTLAGGTLNVGNADGTGSILVSAAAAINADRIRQGALTVNGVARVRPSGADAATSILKSLSIAPDGVLDLNDNDLIIDYDGASPFLTVRNDIYRGYSDFLDPTRRGIISSTAQADPLMFSPILALFDNAVAGWTSFNGLTIDSTTLIAKYTYFGDANLDGLVDASDYSVVMQNMNTTPDPRIARLKGDVNQDGLVTGDDFTIIDSNFNRSASNPLGLDAVPEPGAISLLMSGAAMMLRRKRRKLE